MKRFLLAILIGAMVQQSSAYTIEIAQEGDENLSTYNVDTTYDNLRVEPKLHVISSQEVVTTGEVVTFYRYSNYLTFIEKAELLLFVPNDPSPFATLPFDGKNFVTYHAEEQGKIDYVLRVYDDADHYDETHRKLLTVTDYSDVEKRAPKIYDYSYIYGKNNIATQHIPLDGGTITIRATDSKARAAFVMKQPIMMTQTGSFWDEQIVPPGTHDIAIALVMSDTETITMNRSLYVENQDWFYVAMGDLTFGHYNSSGPAELVTGDDDLDEDVFVDAQFGMYAKGMIKGEYLLTAALNTGEEDLENLFSNLDGKDPRSLIRRIDPDEFYPVYGDDSELVEDAPTKGKFYVKLEKDESHVLWGNFRTSITGTELAKIERGLYGAQLHYQSTEITSFQEPVLTLDGFIAEPGTVSAREEFRGTGGSLYLLENQDITIGSEKMRIEIRDPITGLVLQTNNLTVHEDYDINYIQGRVMLSHALPVIADDGHLVAAGPLSGNDVFLVAHYEHTPTFTDFDSLSTGGRVSTWANDFIMLGATVNKENTTGSKQELYAGDVTVRLNPKSFLKAEVAQSKGPGFGSILSLDGGFNFGSVDQDRTDDINAMAYRVEASVDLADINEKADGTLFSFVQYKDRGFSAQGQLTQYDTTEFGVDVHSVIDDIWSIQSDFFMRDQRGGSVNHNANVDIIHTINEQYYWGLGIEVDNRKDSTATSTTQDRGLRADTSLRWGYDSLERWSGYVFGQTTLNRTSTRKGNSRVGVGGSYAITDVLSLNGELSAGDSGVGTTVAGEYQMSPDRSFYLAYQLDGDSTFSGVDNTGGVSSQSGTFTFGNRTRYSESITAYGEERATHNETQIKDLTHVHGIDYNPIDKNWNIGFSSENGVVDRDSDQEREITAATLSAGYAKEGLSLGSSLEYRQELNSTEERESYLTRNNLTVNIDEDWRALAKFNMAISDSNAGDYFNSDFIETSLGLAYRPVESHRFNGLFKYSYFYDLSGADQLTGSGVTPDYKQRSHVLSLDGTYFITPKFSLGGKYGLKIGEITNSRTSDDFYRSTAQLFVVRADLKFRKKWEGLAELRALTVDLAQDAKVGALLALYYNIDNNFKIGAGYNFSDFDDDLTNLDYNASGIFFNIIATF